MIANVVRFTVLMTALFYGGLMDRGHQKFIKEHGVQKQLPLDFDLRVSTNFIQRAIQLSFIALDQKDGYPSGSVIVKENRVVGEGWNKIFTTFNPGAHAETEAVENAARHLKTSSLRGCIVYSSVQPCIMCLTLLHNAGIERIYYCIPRETMAKQYPDFSANFSFEKTVREKMGKRVHEVPLLADEIELLLNAYKNLYN
jgi:tRNA(Arg) A34 adenosine deaminase TadA